MVVGVLDNIRRSKEGHGRAVLLIITLSHSNTHIYSSFHDIIAWWVTATDRRRPCSAPPRSGTGGLSTADACVNYGVYPSPNLNYLVFVLLGDPGEWQPQGRKHLPNVPALPKALLYKMLAQHIKKHFAV